MKPRAGDPHSSLSDESGQHLHDGGTFSCPLCGAYDCMEVAHDRRRKFIICNRCTLVFVPAVYHLTIDQERQRYELHDNTAGNKGYVRFLEEVARPVVTFSRPDTPILDYGCGKNAVLADVLYRYGRHCDSFDPLFGYPLEKERAGVYGVVIMCEVIEHCRHLHAVLGEVRRLLAPYGVVVIRTRLYLSCHDFGRWWYAQDLTHINFFSWKAVEAAAAITGRTLAAADTDDIFILRCAGSD